MTLPFCEYRSPLASTTALKDIMNEPYLSCVLEEIFFLPTWEGNRIPQSLSDLALRCGKTVEAVARQLGELRDLAQGFQSDLQTAAKDAEIFYVGWEPDFPIPGRSVTVLGDRDLHQFWEKFKCSTQLIAISESAAQSFSTAMFLRQKGLLHAQFALAYPA